MENNVKNKDGQDFSQEKGNVEIVRSKDGEQATSDMVTDSVSVSREGINVKRGGNLVIGSLNLITSPIKETLKDRHEKHYKTNNFHLIADIALVLVVIGLFIAFIFLKGLDTGVDLGIETKMINDNATSGEVENFEIAYHNPSDELITNAKISVRFPDNFSLKNVTPSNIFNETTNTFEIGDLTSGANGKIKLEGLVLAEVGSRQVMTFSFSYRSGNKTKNVLDSLVYSIEDSALITEIDMPKEVYKNVPFRGKLIVKNNGTSDLDNDIEFVLRTQAIEIKNVSHPRVTLNNNAIVLRGLASGEKVSIDFEGLAETERDTAELVWENYIYIENGKIKQKDIVNNLKVSVPKFTAEINTNKKVLSDNESLKVIVSYENQEGADLSGVKMLFYPTNSAFRIDKFILPESSDYQVSGTDLNFSDLIKAGDSGSFEIEVLLTRKNVEVNQEVSLAASIEYSLDSNDINYNIYSSSLKMISDLQVSARGVYYSAQGDQLGIGPLPPIVDIPTRYWVFLEADNLGNKLENLSISAILPNNIFWTDQKSLIAGKIRYGETSKKVVWNVDEVAAENGEYRAGFEIELIPVSTDVGKVLDILKDIEWSAFDAFTQKEISGKLNNINSDLKDDNVASGQGTVVKMNVVR